jgi:predicted membrane protein
MVTNNFKGGKMLAVFGGSNFYLAKCKLAPGKNYIDVLAVFGGFKLVVPEDWNIKISTISIFGGISDKHRMHTPNQVTEDLPELIIKGFVIFGGGEIKSY